MDPNFEAMIEAAVRFARSDGRRLHASDIARRIVCSTPLPASAAEVAEQLAAEAARAGVAVSNGHARERADAGCGCLAAA